MDVSPNALRKETVSTLRDIEAAIESAKKNVMQNPSMMASLLLAKSQCLNTLTMLNEQGKPARGGPRR